MQRPIVQVKEPPSNIRKIFFVKFLVNKMRSPHPPTCTYRNQRKSGLYRVYSGSWRNPSSQKDEGINILIYNSELVKTAELTDQDVQAAGVSNKEEFLRLMKKFYGRIPENMWRNWFIIQGEIE